MELITKFVFDESNFCDSTIPTYETGEDCLLISAKLKEKFIAVLIIYSLLALSLTTFCDPTAYCPFGQYKYFEKK